MLAIMSDFSTFQRSVQAILSKFCVVDTCGKYTTVMYVSFIHNSNKLNMGSDCATRVVKCIFTHFSFYADEFHDLET